MPVTSRSTAAASIGRRHTMQGRPVPRWDLDMPSRRGSRRSVNRARTSLLSRSSEGAWSACSWLRVLIPDLHDDATSGVRFLLDLLAEFLELVRRSLNSAMSEQTLNPLRLAKDATELALQLGVFSGEFHELHAESSLAHRARPGPHRDSTRRV